ncbi:MAG: hypothetical protein AB2662_17330 [Candidatus Thiodiazotropha sp.]
MLKLIKELQHQPNSIWGEIENRILAQPDHIQWYVRLTEGNIKFIANFINEFGMSFTPQQYDEIYVNRLNECERNLVEQLNSTTDPDRLERIETRIKTCVQKTSRMIQSHALDIEAEMELNTLIAEHKSKRTKPKTPMQEEWQKVSQMFH